MKSHLHCTGKVLGQMTGFCECGYELSRLQEDNDNGVIGDTEVQGTMLRGATVANASKTEAINIVQCLSLMAGNKAEIKQ
jgi:hypothetical protein